MFFFSSRRRHTRYWRDWSSDVCSSDLSSTRRGTSCATATPTTTRLLGTRRCWAAGCPSTSTSAGGGWEGVGVGKRVDFGGGRHIKKKKKTTHTRQSTLHRTDDNQAILS